METPEMTGAEGQAAAVGAGGDAPAAAETARTEAAAGAALSAEAESDVAEGVAGSASAGATAEGVTVQAFDSPEMSETPPATMSGNIDLLDDVELDVRIVLGRTEMYVEDVLRLGVGSVVELDKLAGDPVDIYVNEQLVARGEVLVLNENFCVRVNDILSPVPELDGK